MTTAPPAIASPASLDQLADRVRAARRIFVLTGAGCSTDSGIPDYRDDSGSWKRSPPMRYQEFVGSEAARRRYWARSLMGWPVVDAARPNAAHYGLAALARRHASCTLVTQNVDGLHQRAGSPAVLDLHGCLARVRCLDCGALMDRGGFQDRMMECNPEWSARAAAYAPDGDAEVEAAAYAEFLVPACLCCGGTLKPDVVFFGENVPRQRVHAAMTALEAADLMLVLGSSLMVWSGYRFVRAATGWSIPVAAVNLGRTRADAELSLKIAAPCGEVLDSLLRLLD